MTNQKLTPYDTGGRLEPKPWVNASDMTGEECPRRAIAGDYGRVDFDDDADMTVATVWMESDGADGYVLHVSAHLAEIVVILDDRRLEADS